MDILLLAKYTGLFDVSLTEYSPQKVLSSNNNKSLRLLFSPHSLMPLSPTYLPPSLKIKLMNR